MDGNSKSLHALVFPYPTQGHVTPMMQFAKKLASKGLIVTFVTTHHRHSQITQAHSSSEDPLLVEARNLGLDIRSAQISDGLPLDFNRSSKFYDFMQSVDNMGEAFEDLITQLNKTGPPISCVVADTILFWSLAVTKKIGIPWVSFWTQPVAVYSIYYHFHMLNLRGHYPPGKTGAEDRIDYIPGLPPLKAQDLPEDVQKGDPSFHLHQLVVQQLPLLDEAEWIIGNTVCELESEASDAVKERAPFVSLGPFLPPAYFHGEGNHVDFSLENSRSLSLWEEFNCLPWLDTKPRCSVLYVSFGSVHRLPKSQVQEIAKGLLESEQVFLWVIRPDIVRLESTIEDDILPEGFMEKTKNRGLVVPWSPQLQVLSHPSIGGFFTHGGWNSTTESLSVGVPMLVFPLGVDQYTNRMLIVDQWKVGLSLESQRDDGIVEGVEITRCVKALLGDEEMRSKSRQVKEMIRKAVTEGGSSWKRMRSFVGYLMSGQITVKKFQDQPDLESSPVFSLDN